MKGWVRIGVGVAALLIGVGWAIMTDPSADLHEPFPWLVALGIVGGGAFFMAAVYGGMRALGWLVSKIVTWTKPTQAEVRTLDRLLRHGPPLPSEATEAFASNQDGNAPKSAHDDEAIKKSVRPHIARVTSNLAASFAVSAAMAALTDRLAPPSLAQNMAMRVAIAAVPLVLCALISRRVRYYRDTLIEAGATNTVRLLLLGYAGAIGFASGMAFIAWPQLSIARIFLVLAVAFAVASLWAHGMRRELPDWAEGLIASLIVMCAGFATAFLLQIMVWPDGIEYFKYAVGTRATIPEDATSGSNEWVCSFFAATYFALAIGSYVKTIMKGRDISLTFFFFHPIGGYEPWVAPRDKIMESPVGVLGAFAVYSRILFPLAVAVFLPLIL